MKRYTGNLDLLIFNFRVKLYTEYSYRDNRFLNDSWSKYDWLHFKNLLCVIDQMQIYNWDIN